MKKLGIFAVVAFAVAFALGGLAISVAQGEIGTIKTGAAGLRAASTVTTGGTANPLVATAEWIFSIDLSFN